MVSEEVAKYARVAAAFAVPEGAPEAEAKISITRSALSAVRATESALTTVLSPTRAPVSLWMSVQATVPPAATLALPAARPMLAAMRASSKSLSASTAKLPAALTVTPSPTEASAAALLSTRLKPPPKVSRAEPVTASAVATSHRMFLAEAATVTSPAALMARPAWPLPTLASALSFICARDTTAPTPALAVPRLAEPAMTRLSAEESARTVRSPPRVRAALSPMEASTLFSVNSWATVPATLAAPAAPWCRLPEMAST